MNEEHKNELAEKISDLENEVDRFHEILDNQKLSEDEIEEDIEEDIDDDIEEDPISSTSEIPELEFASSLSPTKHTKTTESSNSRTPPKLDTKLIENLIRIVVHSINEVSR